MRFCEARIVACSRGPAYSSLMVRRYSAAISREGPRFLGGAQRSHECVELPQDPRGGVGSRARRSDAVEQAVEFVMLEDGGFVEPLDERAAVIAGGHDRRRVRAGPAPLESGRD